MNKNLTKFNNELGPWSGLRNDVWDLFDRFSRDLDLPFKSHDEFVPKIEVKDKGTSYQIFAEVPGMDEKDINVTLRDNNLIIEGEKKNEFESGDKKKGTYHSEFSYGHFYRTIPLSDDVDTEKVTANYKNGILNVELEKVPGRTSTDKKIQINAGKLEKTKH